MNGVNHWFWLFWWAAESFVVNQLSPMWKCFEFVRVATSSCGWFCDRSAIRIGSSLVCILSSTWDSYQTKNEMQLKWFENEKTEEKYFLLSKCNRTGIASLWRTTERRNKQNKKCRYHLSNCKAIIIKKAKCYYYLMALGRSGMRWLSETIFLEIVSTFQHQRRLLNAIIDTDLSHSISHSNAFPIEMQPNKEWQWFAELSW